MTIANIAPCWTRLYAASKAFTDCANNAETGDYEKLMGLCEELADAVEEVEVELVDRGIDLPKFFDPNGPTRLDFGLEDVVE